MLVCKCSSLDWWEKGAAKDTTGTDHNMITRSALIWLSRQEGLKDFATRFGFFKKLTTRFVAGDTIDEVIPFIREINAENCTASFDHLNESVESAAEAEREVEEYLNILAKIDEQRIRSNVSIKLTQFGLGLDPELAYRNARRVVEEAQRRGNFVRVDMEDSRSYPGDDRYLQTTAR